MIYYIDFDGTICPNSGNPPSPHCIRVINSLKAHNHQIVIYSCRSNPECVEDYVVATDEMIAYLKEYNIPYDSIRYGKPFFNHYIDDRNIGVPLDKDYNVDWEKVGKLIDEGEV